MLLKEYAVTKAHSHSRKCEAEYECVSVTQRTIFDSNRWPFSSRMFSDADKTQRISNYAKTTVENAVL